MRFDLRAGLTRLANDIVAKPGDKKPASSSSAPASKSAPASSKSAPAASSSSKAAPAKKAEPKVDDVLHCPSCGSAGPWTIRRMTMVLYDVPCSKLTKSGEGVTYDDTKGETRDDWNREEEGKVQCNKCEKAFDYNELMRVAGEGKAESAEVPSDGGWEPDLGASLKAGEKDLKSRSASMTREERIARAVKTLMDPHGTVQQKIAFLKDRVGLADDEIQVALGTAEAGDMSAWEASFKRPRVAVKAGEASNRFVMVTMDVEVRPVTDEQVEAWTDLRPGECMGEDLLMQLSYATGEAVIQDNIHFVEAQVSDDQGNLG